MQEYRSVYQSFTLHHWCQGFKHHQRTNSFSSKLPEADQSSVPSFSPRYYSPFINTLRLHPDFYVSTFEKAADPVWVMGYVAVWMGKNYYFWKQCTDTHVRYLIRSSQSWRVGSCVFPNLGLPPQWPRYVLHPAAILCSIFASPNEESSGLILHQFFFPYEVFFFLQPSSQPSPLPLH